MYLYIDNYLGILHHGLTDNINNLSITRNGCCKSTL